MLPDHDTPEPTASVVIATYRASDHLAQAIRSALAQTQTDLEVIVSDDANESGVAQLVRSFDDVRLSYRANATRLGPAGNHWAAFAVARGRYVAVLNHDDLMLPTFVEELAGALDATPDAVLAFCDHEVIDDVGRAIPSKADELSNHWGRTGLSAGAHRDAAALVVKGTVPSAVGAIFRRSALPPFPAFDPAGAYDLYLSSQLTQTGRPFYYVDKRLTAWRIHSSQLTGKPDAAWAHGSLECWEQMSQAHAFRHQQLVVQKRLAQSRYRVARLCWANRDADGASRMAAAAIRADPWHWRFWALRLLTFSSEFLRTRVRG